MAASGRDPAPHPDRLVQDLDRRNPIPTATLTLNGTAIDYDRRGSDGTPLLLLPGGSGHAGVLDRLIAHLAGHYRVVAMSSRVASAARAGTVDEDQHPRVHAEDTGALIATLFDEPPTVFGFSAGAITTLELLARHPEHVKLAIVHEPPVTALLPDSARHRSALEAVRTAARTDGPAAAAKLMTAAMTLPGTDATPAELHHPGDWLDGYAGTHPEPPDPELLELFTRLADLQPVFLEHVLIPFTTGELDLTALEAASARLVPAAGIDSRGQLPYRAAAALAGRLGLPLTELPGGHLGPVERPTQFAHALRALLDERRE
ncbi:alpha/beta hydrolase [Paractinoplanes ferrugineus]|uniref:Alpha/beta hydrolase n=1 Tax=Paractinoplanes ferrugineus TaxID=113564 RepID=A0A919IYJ9_9ACTN|nr:alpha/beta hydrolase [Actinoplanes ferrugineus]GIE10583.1 alpha/beta hydrolase [Actinoplanes ferrugineus]